MDYAEKLINGVSQLTSYERLRFSKSHNCEVCGKLIYDDDSFYMIKKRSGHRVFYFFIHSAECPELKEATAHG